MSFIDLHTHSTYSDGTLSPKEIIELAENIGLSALSLTDHDTVDGLEEFLSCETGIHLVPGLEISCEHKGTLHILGYFIDHKNEDLLSTLSWLREKRSERNVKIVRKLKELGFDVTLEELEEVAGGEVIGRPHMAKVLLNKGYVSSIEEAFEKYLKKGGPAYVDKVRLRSHEAIKLIKEAGGLPVLAHPVTLGLDRNELENFVENLVHEGLEGIEVYYPEHEEDDIEFYLYLSKKFNLVPTGGTDFHGDVKPNIKLGMLDIPFEMYKGLEERWRTIHENE